MRHSTSVCTMDSLESSELNPLPQVEFALVADAVQAVAGKLYVIGGGWDTLFVRSFPARHPTMGIGMRIRVPWSHIDEFSLSVDLVDEDGASLFQGRALSQRIRINRSPAMPAGADMGIVRAFTLNNLAFPKEGGYAFPISVDDVEVSRLRFRLRRRPQPPTAGADPEDGDGDG